MDSRLLEYLADPNDGGTLELHTFEGTPAKGAAGGDQTRTGVLRNAQTGRWYPIRDGIPTLFADALRMGDLHAGDMEFAARYAGRMSDAGCAVGIERDAAVPENTDLARIESERRARDEQAEDYDRMFSLRFYERIETPAYRRALQEYSQSAGSTLPLLEAGCGTGRFTGLFSGLAPAVVAVDMSRDSILRNRVRHIGKTASPLHYVHADLTHLPLRAGVFGIIAHCGVFEHIPSRAMRQQFLTHARRVLHPSGTLLLSAYRYGGLTRLFEKEGEHAGGIPFTRFTDAELRAEVEPFFHIEKFRPNLGVYMSMLVAKHRER